MTFVCYLIVCVTLLYSFDQTESSTPIPRYTEQQDNEELFEKLKNVERQYEYLANIISPYWNLSYDKELEEKQGRSRAMVNTIVKRYDGLNNSCKLLQIAPLPVTRAYRSMDTFYIGHGIDGNPKTVGMKVGKVVLGKTFIIHPTKVSTIKESHKRVAQVYEKVIRLSPLRACLTLNDGGYWRKITIRSNAEDEILASIIVNPKGFTMSTIEQQQETLKQYFMKHLPNLTLYHQQCMYVRCTRTMSPFVLLYGKPYLFETINGYKFKISSETYTPFNKFAAELLYDTVIKTAKLKRNSTVVDIYSGSGGISIMASKFVREAIGVNFIKLADFEAKLNAKNNNITNTKFLFVREESSMKAVFVRLNETSDLVVIVSSVDTPPGLGLIRLIRSYHNISKLLYITNKPENSNAIANFISLCSHSELNAQPFRLTKAIPIDLLPKTLHVELILLFER